MQPLYAILEKVVLICVQPKGGELKAIGKVRRDGVEVAGHSKLMTFGAFELHAKSALRRATGNMYTIKGRILQARSGFDVFHIGRLCQEPHHTGGRSVQTTAGSGCSC